jgi:hypothetical protein
VRLSEQLVALVDLTKTDLHCVLILIKESIMGRGILLWLLGVPIPIIILLALFFH